MLKKLIKPLFGHWRLKGIALLIAVLLWGYADARVRREADIEVPLALEVPKGYVLLYQTAEKVWLHVRGPEELITRLSSRADLTRLRLVHAIEPSMLDEAGRVELKVRPNWLNLQDRDLAQLSFGSIQPAFISVYASRLETKELEVKVQTVGEPPQGFTLERARSIPSKVTVSGPARLLENMRQIMTQEIFLYGQRDSIQRDVELAREVKLPLAEGREADVTLEVTPPQVSVEIAITGEREGQIERKTFTGVPVRVLRPPGFPYAVEIPPESATVTAIVSGPPDSLRRLRSADLTVLVDLQSLVDSKVEPGQSATFKETVRPALPPGKDLTVDRLEPDTVTVTLKNPG